MGNIKNKKIFIGLVILTIVVIAAVVLTVFLVNKYVDVEPQTIEINKLAENDDYTFIVKSMKVEKYENFAKIELCIEINAKKTIRLKEKDFTVNGLKASSSEGFLTSISKGQKNEFKLYYDVSSTQVQFLKYDKYRVALGNVL